MTEILKSEPVHLFVASREGLLAIECDRGETQVRPYALYGHSLRAVAVDDKGVLLAAAGRDGTAWSTSDDGRSWKELAKLPGEVRVLARSGGTLFAGLAPAGLLRSRDAGGSYQALAEFAGPWTEEWKPGGDEPAARVSSIAVRGSRVLVAVFHGGLLVSETGGDGFRKVGGGLPAGVLSVAGADGGDDEFLAGTVDGLYKTTKLGTNAWKQLFLPVERRAVSAIAVDPTGAERLIIGASRALLYARPGQPGGADSAIFWSENRGETFQAAQIARLKVMRGRITSTVWLERQPERVFVGTTTGEIFESRDHGRSFRLIASSLPGVVGMVAGPAFR